jgi:hypothetical protein
MDDCCIPAVREVSLEELHQAGKKPSPTGPTKINVEGNERQGWVRFLLGAIRFR